MRLVKENHVVETTVATEQVNLKARGYKEVPEVHETITPEEIAVEASELPLEDLLPELPETMQAYKNNKKTKNKENPYE